MILYLKPAPADEPPATTYFDMFVSSTQELLRGELDATSYEDRMRAAYGIHSYITVTLDKLVRSCARQVGLIVRALSTKMPLPSKGRIYIYIYI
jgi:paired amphipathic helix protein Sin3a